MRVGGIQQFKVSDGREKIATNTHYDSIVLREKQGIRKETETGRPSQSIETE